MATAAGDGAPSSYGGRGGGAGGKFRKKPIGRTQTTPYDRPPTALRTTGTWLSKLVVDPASKLISSTAHYFLSPLLRKRLPPPPEDNQEHRERHHEEVPNNHASTQETTIDEGGNLANSSDGSRISELEQMLKQKTFTRSEIDHLTNLLHSRTVDLSAVDGEKGTEANLLKPVSGFERHQEFASTPANENRNERDGFHGCISTPVVSARIFEEDVASPAELAKAYMGSRPSKVSPSMLGLRSQMLREDATLQTYVPFPTKSPSMSLVPKTAVRVGVPDNVFTTPRSRGRSAIYSMARTPYPRIHSTASQKGIESTNFSHRGAPLLSSSSRPWEHDRQLGFKQVSLKRRSSVIDDDIGSVSSMRRTRQKPNLLSVSQGGRLSTREERKDKAPKTVEENKDSSFPSTSYASVPSKSSEIATKILQHLEKLSPKEKSSESKLAAVREKSPAKWAPNMFCGQALRSLEDVGSLKLRQNSQDNHKLEDLTNHSLPDARDSSSRKANKVEENGPKELLVPRDILTPAVNGDATVSPRNAIPTAKMADSIITNFVTQPPQTKQAFLMSAHEDSSELDDGIRGNGSASTLLADGKGKQETSRLENKAVFAEDITLAKAPALPEVKAAVDHVPNKRFDLEIADGSMVGNKNAGFSFRASHSPSTTFQPVVSVLGQSTSAVNKIVLPKEANTPLLFSFSSKDVDEVLPSFSSSFSANGSSGPKSSAWPDSNRESSNSLTHLSSGLTDAQLKIPESDKIDNTNIQKAGDRIGKSETSFAVSPSASNIVSFGNPANTPSSSTSASASNIFAFGNPGNKSSPTKGSLGSSPSIFSSAAPVLSSSNLMNPTVTNNSTLVASSTSTSTLTTTSSTAVSTAASNSSLSVSTGAPSFSAPPVFKFGSSVLPSTSVSAFSTTSSNETTDMKNAPKKELTFGNVTSSPFGGTSFAMASSGGSIFGFSASVNSSTANNQFQGSLFGTGNGSLVSTQLPCTESAVATVSSTIPIQFGGSSPSPLFGSSGTSFTSSSSLFGSSTPAVKLFSSGASFGLSSSASSSETNPVSSSNGPTSGIFNFGASSSSSSGTNSVNSSISAPPSIFGSGLQPTKSPIITSAFNTPSPSTGFSFGASSKSVDASNNAPLLFGSSTGATSASIFSFTTASAMTSTSPSLSQTQPVFGNSIPPVFSAASGNGGDQMNMEDSMAEDPVQASTTAVSIFGQPPISPPPSAFMFGSSAPSPANPFQFGGQQNQVTPQNPSPFQASNSLEFSAGGSFSLGTGGVGDKSTRRKITVKKTRKK